MSAPKMDKEKQQEIARLFSMGLSIRAICKMTSAGARQVVRYGNPDFCEANRPVPVSRIDPETKRKIISLRGSGLSCTQVAKSLGVDYTTVKKYGEEAFENDWPPLPTPAEIEERSLAIRAERDERRTLRLCPRASSHIPEPVVNVEF